MANLWDVNIRVALWVVFLFIAMKFFECETCSVASFAILLQYQANQMILAVRATERSTGSTGGSSVSEWVLNGDKRLFHLTYNSL